jgi:hypothetical protein
LTTPIVATAWLYMQQCNAFDGNALRDFIAMHAGKNQGH